MVDTLRVLWTIVPQTATQPWLSCSRCSTAQPFRSSGMFRVNANGKRLDAWLIYNCTACANTWNRPILKRRHVNSVEPLLLANLRANDPATAMRVAFDLGDLRRNTEKVGDSPEVLVQKKRLSGGGDPLRRLEIVFALPLPIRLRADRLLAAELGLTRRRIQQMQDQDRLALSPDRARGLRSAPQEGTQLTIDLSQERDAAAIAAAAQWSDRCSI